VPGHVRRIGNARGVAEVEFRWKEEVIYWEGNRGFVFDGGWGVAPMVTYIPDEATWDDVVPDWLVGKRQQVVERLALEPGHVLKATSDYSAHQSSRRITRP
jgi:hypothetical protein